MKSKYLALGFATALAALAGCSHSEAPKPAAKKSVADTYSAPKEETAPSTAVAVVSPEVRPVSPDQIPHVGTAPPGEVAFGPSAPNTGMDPVGDAERAQMIADREASLAAQKAQTVPQPTPAKKSHQ